MDQAQLISALGDAVGPGNVLTGADVDGYTTDPRGVPGPEPIAVVRPADTIEVAAVVEACGEAGVAIVTQGGHTGMSGGAQVVAPRPSVVLSTQRMTRIDSVDVGDSTVTCQAGATIESAHDAARQAGLKFAPDWGARGTATIGGAIATNAGGNNVLHYGSMRDHVLGLEVVLADGRIWDGRRSLLKDSSGYRLRDLFIGAEGTLGVVTGAVLRLVAEIPDERSVLVALPELAAGPALLSLIRGQGLTVTAFELIPEAGLTGVVEKFGRQRPLDAVADWHALIRIGSSGGVDLDELSGATITEGIEAGLVRDAVVAVTPDQEANLWNIRDEISPSLLFPDTKDGAKYDVAVPLGRVVEFIERASALVREIGGAQGWQPYAFGHLGDGNVHFYGLAHAQHKDAAAQDAIRLAIEEAVDALVVELAGTLSAEHGVGRMLVDRIGLQKPAIELELAARIKHALDPEELFNPGKTVPSDSSILKRDQR